ncbi:hypothetical protein F4808DRAFT_178807 [Astrocystis sublimbata]|nr:hypothetical protein F4808DRAFT_178807 [Astrocystis sublimbata]
MRLPLAVSPSLQCHNALRCHSRPRYDSAYVWISDSLLASSFERYAATFCLRAARHASSTPGPMEHRKRLARRHMGELHFGQSHSAAPVWELASLVDLTRWQWEPPIDRRRDHHQTNLPDETDLTENLEETPADTTRNPTTPDLIRQDDAMLPNDAVSCGLAAESSPPLASRAAAHPVLDMISAALESCRQSAKHIGSPALSSDFCHGWRQAVADGTFQAKAIRSVLERVKYGAIEQAKQTSDRKLADRVKLQLATATIQGLSQRATLPDIPFDHVAWNHVLHMLATIRLNTIRIFTSAMASIPQQSLIEVSEGILENLDRYLIELGRAGAQPTVVRQAAKMAVPLETLVQPELHFIQDMATQRVLDYARDGRDGLKSYRYIRLGWLLVLARKPGLSAPDLARLCNALESAGRPFRDVDICRIFLVWANSQAPLKQYSRLCNNILRVRGTICYRLLAAHLWDSRQYCRVRPFSDLLRATGRENNLHRLANFRRRRFWLSKMASAMRRPQAAIDILSLYEESQTKGVPFWESAFGYKALEILSWVPNFDYNRLRRISGIVTRRELRKQQRQGRVRALLGQAEAKITAVAIVAPLSRHLSTRKAFSLLMDCYVNLKRHKTMVPLPFLRALMHNVSRPLANGQPGITSRIAYALRIIYQQEGRMQAQKLALAITGRRKYNMQLQRMGPGNRYRS